MTSETCPTCGGPLISGNCERCANRAVFRIVQREIGQLVLLALITIPLFFFTRSMAGRNRQMNVEIAGLSFRQGQEQLKAGDTTAAVESFRNASTSDHDNADYTLALARALAAADHVEEARQALLRLRASAPENGEINLNLARLAAGDDQKADAVRYYHNALYGAWPAKDVESQRVSVRRELVRFLLTRGDASEALSELLILSAENPDSAQDLNQLGQLFMQAGDNQHALEQYNRTLALDAKNVESLKGAGLSAFNLGDLTKARRYLESAVANGGETPEINALLETARYVLARDPLASGIRTEERIRRLTADLSFTSNELQACADRMQTDTAATAALQPLLAEIEQGLKGQFEAKALRSDADGFTAGLNVIQRAETAVEQICRENSPLHRALLLIGKKHGVLDQ